MVVLDERFAATMRAHIERAILDGVPVRAEEFAHIGWLRRASYGAAYMVYKLVMRIFAIGYA